jgi:hypothetical protein
MTTDGAQYLQFDFPKELDGFWVHVCVELDSSSFTYIVSIYKNNDYPTGTVIISKYLPYAYPDMYGCFDKGYQVQRMYTNPIHRRNGYWVPFGVFLKKFFAEQFGVNVDGTGDRSKQTDRIYARTRAVLGDASYVPPIKGGRIEYDEAEPPRDPAFPLIWFGQRIGGFNEQG